jgi:hypothetical protein
MAHQSLPPDLITFKTLGYMNKCKPGISVSIVSDYGLEDPAI